MRGYGSVDMEAATLFAVAKHFGFAATALLVVWDQLTADRSFLDPLTLRRTNPTGRRQHRRVREQRLEVASDITSSKLTFANGRR